VIGNEFALFLSSKRNTFCMENDNSVKPEQKGQQMSSKYKFKDLKVHSSDEWMADGTKKYRKVYDRQETTYMRAELSIINKLFDEEDWEASFRLKCFYLNGSQKNELCNLELARKVTKDENIVFIRQAWGNQNPGSYWLRGDYCWEAYIDEVKIGESKFYVEDVGSVLPDSNPYFEIESIRLFEGDLNAYTLPEKKYLTKFDKNATRFVWAEFNFKNKTTKDYYAELIFNFFDDAGQPKGRSNPALKYIPVNTAGQVYTVFPGWGGETAGTWKDDGYTMQVVFMDTLIATIPFQMGPSFEEGAVSVVTDSGQLLKTSAKSNSNANKSRDEILSDALAELNSLTGIDQIKQEVNELVKLVRFYQETGKDILNKFSLHTVFTGNPGTGKTTVARILSRVYQGLGILEKGHLVEVDRPALVAGYVGQTAIKTNDRINEAIGGILFIDEAYSLANEKDSQHDFGGESIQVILKRMEDMRGKFGVIVAGYTDNMHDFITSNPGLQSRFDKNFYFHDYSGEDMFTIALAMFKREEVVLNEAAATHLKNYFKFLHEGRDKNFGNARAVRQVVGEAVRNQHLRLAAIQKDLRTKEMMETIILDDVKEFEIKEVPSSSRSVGFKYGASEQ
jgi:AAA+ superfamily predicted ATPase